MTKISSKTAYPKKKPISSDYFVGTDSEDFNKTVNFGFEEVAGLVNKLNGTPLLNYVFNASPYIDTEVLVEGRFLSLGSELNTPELTKLYVNKFNNSGDNLQELYLFLQTNATDFYLKLRNSNNQNNAVYFDIASIEDFPDYFILNISIFKENEFLPLLQNLNVYFFDFELKATAAGASDPLKLDKGGYTGTAQDLSNSIKNIAFPDQVLKTGEIVITGLNAFVSAGDFQWRLNQVDFLTAPEFSEDIDPATDGFNRTDILEGDNAGIIHLKKGVESEAAAPGPEVTTGRIILAGIPVFGSTVGTPILLPNYDDKYLKRYKSTYKTVQPIFNIEPSQDDYNVIFNNTTNSEIRIYENGHNGGFIKNGAIYPFKSLGIGNVTVINSGIGVIINAPNGLVLNKNQQCYLIKDDYNEWTLVNPRNLQNIDNTSDATKPVSGPQQTALDLKIDKVAGKGLSTEDYTTSEKNKLASIDATHYLAPLQTTVQLSALPQATVSDKARVYVENDLSDYFYDVTASSGDIAPDDQAGGIGFWRKVAVGGETAASIKTKYESNTDTNAFTNALKAKLDSITEIFTTTLKTGYDGVVTGYTELIATGSRLITTGEITKLTNTSGTNSGDNATNTQYSGLAASKQDALVSGANIKTIEGQSLLGSGNIDLVKSDVGLSNVDNTSDINKPISTATQTALDLKENLANKQNSLAVDGTGTKYPTVDAVNALKWIKSNESLSLAQRKGDVLYGILDQYTGEEITLSKVTGTPTVDGVIYFQLGSEYFKRNFSTVNVKWFNAKGDNSTDDSVAFDAVFNNYDNIYIPSGTYIINGVSIRRNNVSIKGESKNTTILKMKSGVDNIVLEIGETAWTVFPPIEIKNINISGLTIDGDYLNTPVPSTDLTGQGIACTYMSYSSIKDVKAINTHNAGIAIVINSNYNFIQAEVDTCGKSLVIGAYYPGFDVNSSKYSQFDVISSNCNYGARLLDNCFNNIFNVNVKDAALTGFVYNNYYLNESHGNTINATIEGGCSDYGVIIGENVTNSTINATVNNVIGAGLIEIDSVVDDVYNPKSNIYNISTSLCGKQSVLSYGSYGNFTINSYKDGRTGSAGSNFSIDVYGSYNHINSTIIDGATPQVRGLVLRSTSSYNDVGSLLNYNLVQSLENLGTNNKTWKTGNGISSSFVKADGSLDTNVYAPLSANNLFTGSNSFSNLIETTGVFSNPSSADGFRLKTSDNGGVANDSGIGVEGNIAEQIQWYNSIWGHKWYSGGATLKMFLNELGNLFLYTTPATSAGTYDILTRNASTGAVEKITSSIVNILPSNNTFTGENTFSNYTILGAPITLKEYTVATLPEGNIGDVAYVTDALAPTYLTVIVGNGAVITPVFYNGAAWVAH